MPNLNVAVLGAQEYAKGLGKKSTTSDITFYDLKQGNVTVSIVEPTKYPEKLASLFFATSLADEAVVVVDQISPVLGETIIMLDSLGIKKGYIVLRNFIAPDQLTPFIKGTVLEGYSIVEDDQRRLREDLLADAVKLQHPAKGEEHGSVAVDHFFDVKGVGTVVLGCVADGTVRKHDAVKVLPPGIDAEIRSIQKHDDDFDDAQKGDRVGLALKGATVEDLDRGTVLSTDTRLVKRNEISGKARVVKYWTSPLKEGMVLHLGHWMQFEPARIESVAENEGKTPTVRLKLQKDLVFLPGSKAVITYLEGGKLRVVGTLDLA